MSKPFISLREAADDFNAGKCQLRTDVEVRIGDDVTRWELTLDSEWPMLNEHGRPTYSAVLLRAGIEVGDGQPPPEALWGSGPLDANVIMRVLGIDPDARVWTRGSMYDTD